jgi:hypothetical protein
VNVIYLLRDPRSREVRYIGKTTQSPARRVGGHLDEARNYQHHRAKWLRSVVRDGFRPEFYALLSVPEHIDVNVLERFFIASGESLGFRLVNGTAGGDGAPLTGEARLKQSAACKKAGSDPRLRAKRSQAARLRWADPAFKAKLSARMAEPATREKKRASMAVATSDPAYRENMRAKLKEKWKDPHFRAKVLRAKGIEPGAAGLTGSSSSRELGPASARRV